MAKDIHIKVISKNPLASFQFFELPQILPQVHFTLAKEATDYDWLVVYDDLPASSKERLSNSIIHTHCPQSRTVLCTYEPSSVKHYGTDYVNQFGLVLTSHEPHYLAHPNRRNMPPVGVWCYGGLDEILAHPAPPSKSHTISLFHSSKRDLYTFSARRFDFLQAIISALGDDLHLYGHHIRPVQYKATALDPYRYHIAVENHIGAHHWTEKLSDCFLGYCLPFYFGCPNLTDYFPSESFIPIDTRDVTGTLKVIRSAIANNEYEKRLPAICEARRRVIEDYNFTNLLSHHIVDQAHHQKDAEKGKLYSRHAMMRRTPLHWLRYSLGKIRNRYQHRRYWQKY